MINGHSCLHNSPDVRIVGKLLGIIYQWHFFLWAPFWLLRWFIFAVSGKDSLPGFEVVRWRLDDLMDHLSLLDLLTLAAVLLLDPIWACLEHIPLEYLRLSIRWHLKSVLISVKIVRNQVSRARDFASDLWRVVFWPSAIFLACATLWVTEMPDSRFLFCLFF